MQATYSKNSSGSFLDVRDFVMGICVSAITTVIQQPVPLSRNKKVEDSCKIQYSSNSNLLNINESIEVISKINSLRETIRKASPYEVERIENLPSIIKKDDLFMVDVYTISDHKDDFILFEAEGKVLNDLPENYYIRYF
ncbi:hypothetical protein ACOL3I_08325 [Aliarcobacter butzleri]